MHDKAKTRIFSELILFLALIIPFMMVTSNAFEKISFLSTPSMHMVSQAIVLSILIKIWLKCVFQYDDFYHHYLELDKKSFVKFLKGTLLGIAAAMVIVVLDNLTGSVTRVFNRELLGVGLFKFEIATMIFFIAEAFIEEMVTRGYVLEQFVEISNISLGLLVSSIVFVVVQFLWDNPNTNAIGWLNLFIIAAFLGLLYLNTLSKWLCIGFHAAWSFVFSSVFPGGNLHEGHFVHMESLYTTAFLALLFGVALFMFIRKQNNSDKNKLQDQAATAV